MKLTHTSPSPITEINRFGTFNDCLFFSTNRYVMTASNEVYTYEINIDEDSIVRASELHDQDIIEEMALIWDLSEEDAEGLLDGSVNGWTDIEDWDGDKDWAVQAYQGKCAKKMGYVACESEDEQGSVWIVPMSGKESDLTLVDVSIK